MSIFDWTLGAELIGVLASTLLYGITVLQTIQFFMSPPPTSKKQTRLPQVMVALACGLETAHTVLVWTWMYWVVVTNYGNIAALNEIPWMLLASLMVYAVTGAMVQAFFTYRIFVITKSWKYAIPGWFLEVVSVAFTAALCGVASHSTGFLDFHARYTWLAFVILINCAVIDVYNTVLLCWFLKRMDSGFSSSTHAVVNSVATFAIETGILQAVAAVTTLALWSAKPSSGLWIASLMIHTKLYSNSLLGTLNNRSRLRDKLSMSRLVVGNETSRSESRSGSSGTRSGSRHTNGQKPGSLPHITSDVEWAMNTISFRQDDGTEARPAIASKDSQDVERLGFEHVEGHAQ